MTITHSTGDVRIPLALNFSGGISLGAYMAGVFYELTREALQENSQIVVDIITGASAGAISSVLAAYYLLGAEPLPSNAKDSLFYKAWVEEVEISKLIPIGTEAEEDSVTQAKNWSLLSGKFIEELAEQLIGDFKTKIEQANRDPLLLNPLALLITLTNLQGYLKKTNFPLHSEYNLDAFLCEATTASRQKDVIETISSTETRQFLFHSELPLDKLDSMWQKAERSARASGAFPVAFPPIGDDSNLNSPNLVALSDDYFEPASNGNGKGLKSCDELKGIRKDSSDDQTLRFQYTDGGVLDGLPIVKAIALESTLLGTAKLLEEKQEGLISEEAYTQCYRKLAENYPLLLDQNFNQFLTQWMKLGVRSRSEKRLYVYIQPTPSNNLKSRSSLTMGRFSMLEVGMSGLTLPKSEHDAIRLEDIRVRNEDAKRKQELLDLLNDPKFQVLGADLKRRLVVEIEKAVPYRTIQLCRIDPSLMSGAFSQDKMEKFPAVHSALEEVLPQYMKDAIEAQDDKVLLASDFLGAFGGFFDKTYREHDFLLGRICGQLWLIENVWKVKEDKNKSDLHVSELVELIQNSKDQFLERDPQPSNLSKNGVKQIEQLVWRAIVLTASEFTRPKAEVSEETQEYQNLFKQVLWGVVLQHLAIPFTIIALIVVGAIAALCLAID